MKIVIQDIFLKYILRLTIFTQKEKGWKSRKTYLWHRRQEKICYSHKSFKTRIKRLAKTKEGTQNNSVETKSMVKDIY